MLFQYKAIKGNQVINGKVESTNLEEAIAYVKTINLTPIEVKRSQGFDMSFLRQFTDHVSFNDIVDFTRQLAIMLNAGLTLVDSFDILKKQVKKPSLLKIISTLDRDIRSGKNFSDSLRKFPYLFPNLYIALVKSGEASGKLSDILLQLAENLEKQREFAGKIKGALIYPVIVIIGMISVMFIMITFVIPKLLGLYKDFNVELPFTTRVLIYISDFSSTFWPFILIGVAISVYFVRQYFRTKKGKFIFDTYMLKIPYISSVIRMSVLVDSTRTLAILISSGVSIIDSLNIIRETTNNIIFQSAFASIKSQVEKGTSLGQAMNNEGVFPPILVQMATVGEQTGHLDDTLIRIARYFEMESELAVKAMTALIEPLILVILGIGVGFLVMSVITPIYSLTNNF